MRFFVLSAGAITSEENVLGVILGFGVLVLVLCVLVRSIAAFRSQKWAGWSVLLLAGVTYLLAWSGAWLWAYVTAVALLGAAIYANLSPTLLKRFHDWLGLWCVAIATWLLRIVR